MRDDRPPLRSATWRTITALAFGQLVAWGILYYGFAVIVVPMGSETGWTKPEMNGALSWGLCVSGLCAYFVGRWIDRHGGREVMALGAALGSAGLLLWSQITELWQLYAVWTVIGLAISMTLYEAAFAVAAWLDPQGYRKGITVITLLGGLASTAFIPVMHGLVETQGWRGALMIAAAIEFAVCVAIPLIMLPRTGRPQSRQGAADSRWTLLHEMKREPVFWLLVVSYLSHAFFYTSVLFNLLPLLDARGIGVAAAIAVYATIGPSQVAGRLGMLALNQIIPTAVAGFVATVLPVIAMLVFMVAPSSAGAAYVFAGLFGMGMGIKTIVQATAAPEFLHQKSYGALQGLIAFPVSVAQAASPFLAALIWELSGRPDVLMLVLFAFAAVSAIAFLLAARLAAIRNAPAVELT